jgi:hypothetical protein
MKTLTKAIAVIGILSATVLGWVAAKVTIPIIP